MELVIRELPKDCEIVDTGDWHIGPLNCNMSGILQLVKYLKENPLAFVWFKGDMIDAIEPSDKRYAHAAMSSKELLTPEQQSDRFLEIVHPVRKQILGVQDGNHEFKQFNVIDWAKHWSKELDVPYGGIAAKLIVKDSKGKTKFKMFFTHGYGSVTSNAKDTIQAQANIKATIKKKLNRTGHVDCIYMSMGHIHKLIAIHPTVGEEIILTDDGKKIKQEYRVFQNQMAKYIPPDARYYGCSGSFLNLYTPPGKFAISYSEMAMYGPPEHGYLKAVIKNNEMVDLIKVVL